MEEPKKEKCDGNCGSCSCKDKEKKEFEVKEALNESFELMPGVKIRPKLITELADQLMMVFHDCKLTFTERDMVIYLLRETMLSQKMEVAVTAISGPLCEKIIEEKLNGIYSQPIKRDESKPRGDFLK